jgi:hypothetical protein
MLSLVKVFAGIKKDFTTVIVVELVCVPVVPEKPIIFGLEGLET